MCWVRDLGYRGNSVVITELMDTCAKHAGIALGLGAEGMNEGMKHSLPVSLALRSCDRERRRPHGEEAAGRLLPSLTHVLGVHYTFYRYTDVFIVDFLPKHFLWMDLKSQVKWSTAPYLAVQ